MPARLVRREGFALDVEGQVDWHEQHGELERLRRFGRELLQLETLLARFPELGVRVDISGLEVRKPAQVAKIEAPLSASCPEVAARHRDSSRTL